MKNNFSLIIPSKTQEGIKFNHKEATFKYSKLLGLCFGGFTVRSNSIGGYVMNNGTLMIETISEVICFFDCGQFDKVSEAIKIATQMKKELNQECVTYILNGEMKFL